MIVYIYKLIGGLLSILVYLISAGQLESAPDKSVYGALGV
jgi:hypothetical protein